MDFRKAEEIDSERVLKLYKSVLGGQFTVWNELYPGKEEIRHDTENGCLYLLTDGKNIAGAVSIVPENEMDCQIAWQYTENVREISRICISPDYQGRGLSFALVNNISEVLKERGYGAVHLSVAQKNIPAIKNYRKLGFEFRGEAVMYGNSYFLCEKKL